MLTLTDEFMGIRTLSPVTWKKYITTLGATEVVDLIGLVNIVAQVQVEAPIAPVAGIAR